MNRILRRLPDGLREGIGQGKQVTITIEVESSEQAEDRTSEDWFSAAGHIRRDWFKSDKEVDEHSHALRLDNPMKLS